MCIIAIKPLGVSPLPEDIIQTCFIYNSDGAGFAVHQPGLKDVLIRKGFMDVDALLEALDDEEISTADTVVYHFRLATSGGVRPGLCHPFPVSCKAKDLYATEIYCKEAFAHNGVFHGLGTRRMSDTQMYIRDTLSWYFPDVASNLKNVESDTIGSRTVTLDHNGKLYLTGNWIIDNGYIYSNDGYCRRVFADLELEIATAKLELENLRLWRDRYLRQKEHNSIWEENDYEIHNEIQS